MVRRQKGRRSACTQSLSTASLISDLWGACDGSRTIVTRVLSRALLNDRAYSSPRADSSIPPLSRPKCPGCSHITSSL